MAVQDVSQLAALLAIDANTLHRFFKNKAEREKIIKGWNLKAPKERDLFLRGDMRRVFRYIKKNSKPRPDEDPFEDPNT